MNPLPLGVILLALASGCRRDPVGLGPGDGGNADAPAAPDAPAGPDAGAGSDAATDGPDGRPNVVDPAVSRAWTWRACGTIVPDPVDLAAVFDATGRIGVLNERGIRIYDAAGALSNKVDEPAEFLIAAPDGALLGGTITSSAIVMRSIGASDARFAFDLPRSVTCGKSVAFSPDGAYLLAAGGSDACVWRTANRSFVGSFPTPNGQAAIRGDRIVILDGLDQPLYVVTTDLSGAKTNRLRIEAAGPAFLSPSGDRLFTARPEGAALWELDQGTRIASMPDLEAWAAVPTFSPKGDRILLRGGVFRASDGARIQTIEPASRLATGHGRVLALSPDGRRVVQEEFGRATLEDVGSPGIVAVLGSLPVPGPFDSRRQPIDKLALSADGSVLVANVQGRAGFGLRLAARFAESKVLWHMFSEINVDVDVSADGELAAIGGDGRGLFSGVDGRILWPPPVPPPDVTGCFTEGLRFSPNKTWAAGCSYQRTVDVFALRGAAGTASRQPLLRVPARCGDAVAFSRDERLMATSTPALYRTATTAGEWQKLWSAEIPPPPTGLSLEGWANDVRFSPDEKHLLVSRCDPSAECAATLVSVTTGEIVRTLPELRAAHPTFSPDGSWIVAGGTLLHLSSGEVRTLDSTVTTTTALFTPEADVLAGAEGGVTRYCRSP